MPRRVCESLPATGTLRQASDSARAVRFCTGRRDPFRTSMPLIHGMICAMCEAVTSPFRTAERFSVEEIIDPRDTRPILCDWAERAHELVRHELHQGPKTRGLRP